MLGIPCLVASQADLEWLQREIGRSPQSPVAVDVEKQEVRFGDRTIRRPSLMGRGISSWEGLGISDWRVLGGGAGIETTARKLPYVAGW